jgi:hypothetical protein
LHANPLADTDAWRAFYRESFEIAKTTRRSEDVAYLKALFTDFVFPTVKATKVDEAIEDFAAWNDSISKHLTVNFERAKRAEDEDSRKARALANEDIPF